MHEYLHKSPIRLYAPFSPDHLTFARHNLNVFNRSQRCYSYYTKRISCNILRMPTCMVYIHTKFPVVLCTFSRYSCQPDS